MKMPTYRALPLLRPLIALILGIGTAFRFPDWDTKLLIGIGLFFFLLQLFFQYVSFAQKLRLYWVSGISIFAVFFLLGYFSEKRKDISRQENWIGQYENTVQNFVFVLDENPAPKTKTYLAKATTMAVKNENQYNITCGTILLRIDTVLQRQYDFKENDTLMIQTNLRRIQNFPNSSFDVAAYYARRQIFFQSNIKPQNLIDFHVNQSKNIAYWLDKSRYWILEKLRAGIRNKDNLSLAEALLIGYKDDLDKNLENAYRDAGIVHIIAISGMHLILLYKLLELTGFLLTKNIRARKRIRLLTLIVIWLFAFLSEAGPSVIRAAVMLSFIVIGEVFYRNNHSLNSLVTSAFVLLVVQPEWIWNVGFWLSYMAVLGILLFYKPILQWPDLENPFVRIIWESIAVTLAAQLLTVPVLMYCFGKIPLYFLFTNLLMVPLSSVILYGIILLLAVGWLPFLANIIGTMTDFLIGLMNGFVRNVAQYPLANISVSIGFFQMLVLYGIIGAVLYWMESRGKKLTE